MVPNLEGSELIIRLLMVRLPTPWQPTNTRVLRINGGIRATSSYIISSALSYVLDFLDENINFFFLFDIWNKEILFNCEILIFQ